jgi:hypothetical protein
MFVNSKLKCNRMNAVQAKFKNGGFRRDLARNHTRGEAELLG